MNNSITIKILITSVIFGLMSCSSNNATQTDAEKLRLDCLANNTAEIPDLIVTNIYKKPSIPYYYYVEYMNIGTASNEGDFLIYLSSSKGEYPGNANYRFTIPEPCTFTSTGGYGVSLLGITETESAEITAEIDWEDRVVEEDEENNIFVKQVNAQ